MPLFDFDDANVWTGWYQIPMDDGRTLAYEREAKERILGFDHLELLRCLDIQPGATIALIGCGYAWIGEDWQNAGYGPIVNCDISAYIHANKTANAAVEILQESSLTVDSRNRVKAALSLAPTAKIDWVITEDVLPCLYDHEVLELALALRDLGSTVAHWITPGYGSDGSAASGQESMNCKSLESWKAMLDPDLVVRRGGAEVL